MIHKFWLALFYGFANKLPDSYTMILGGYLISLESGYAATFLRSAVKLQQSIETYISETEETSLSATIVVLVLTVAYQMTSTLVST